MFELQKEEHQQAACCPAGTWQRSACDHAVVELVGRFIHKRLRLPQANGKAERFNHSLLDEWVYARLCRSETERRTTLRRWVTPDVREFPRDTWEYLHVASYTQGYLRHARRR